MSLLKEPFFCLARWELLPPMPTARLGCTAVALPDGDILVVGGSNDGCLTTVEALTRDGVWCRLASMRRARSRPGVAFFAQRVVVAGGWGEREWEGSVEVFRPTRGHTDDDDVGEWTTINRLTKIRNAWCFSSVFNGRLFVMGKQDVVRLDSEKV